MTPSRACTAILVIGCGCHADCPHGAVLTCVLDAHDAAQHHRDIDDTEWKAVAGG